MNSIYQRSKEARKSNRKILEPILYRWSPRAMSGEQIEDVELATLFEAASWAPSTYNEQEWRFSYARNGSAHWQNYFSFLMEPNQAWCNKAAVLVVACSRKKFTHNQKDNSVHTLDCGMACQNLLVQASAMDLVAHGMAGFYKEKVRSGLQVPDVYEVECMIAIGKPGPITVLAPELQDREMPSGRKSVEEFTAEGAFPFT